MKHLFLAAALAALLLLSACGADPVYRTGKITSVDKDFKIIFSSHWNYTFELEDGTSGRGRSKLLVKKGWTITFKDNVLWSIAP